MNANADININGVNLHDILNNHLNDDADDGDDDGADDGEGDQHEDDEDLVEFNAHDDDNDDDDDEEDDDHVCNFAAGDLRPSGVRFAFRDYLAHICKTEYGGT